MRMDPDTVKALDGKIHPRIRIVDFANKRPKLCVVNIGAGLGICLDGQQLEKQNSYAPDHIIIVSMYMVVSSAPSCS